MSLLRTYQDREKRILASEDVVHSFDRNWPAYLALPLIDLFVANHIIPKVLEVGCGNGYALKTILEENPAVDASNLVGTSLSSLPGHNEINRLGINVYTDIVAENLPSSWKNSMDIVMANVVMQWTNLEQAVPSILRTIKSGGYFLGYDEQRVNTEIVRIAKGQIKITQLSGRPSSIADYQAFVIQKH